MKVRCAVRRSPHRNEIVTRGRKVAYLPPLYEETALFFLSKMDGSCRFVSAILSRDEGGESNIPFRGSFFLLVGGLFFLGCGFSFGGSTGLWGGFFYSGLW